MEDAAVDTSFSADVDSTFDGAVDETPETAVEDIVEDLPVGGDEPDDLPPAEVEPVAEQPPVVDAPPTEAPKEKLPDGVRMGEKDGKKTFYLNESRYRTMESGLHFQRELEQRLVPDTANGQPATIEDLRAAINIREQAFMGNEEMHQDFLSGNPESQRKFIDHWLSQGARAVQNGEVASDPIVPLAATFFDTLAEKHPDAYGAIQAKAAEQLVADVFEVAVAEGNDNLFLSIQHLSNLLFNRYPQKDGSWKEGAPREQRGAPSPRLNNPNRNQPRQAPAAAARPDQSAQQWDNFRSKTDTSSKTAIRSSVETSLAEVKKAYDKAGVPEHYGAMLDRLNSVVQKELNGDAEWQRQIRVELRAAQMTPSEQRRAEIGERITRRYATRAQQIIQKHIGPITAEAARVTNVRFDAEHKRREAAQNKRAPGGGGPLPKESLLPESKNGWDSSAKGFSREIDALFG